MICRAECLSTRARRAVSLLDDTEPICLSTMKLETMSVRRFSGSSRLRQAPGRTKWTLSIGSTLNGRIFLRRYLEQIQMTLSLRGVEALSWTEPGDVAISNNGHVDKPTAPVNRDCFVAGP